ncbi:site-specific integrase [bacterium]|nr:site-specific integrase [bacterium]
MEKEIIPFQKEHFDLSTSYEQARSSINDSIWKRLGNISVDEAIENWLETLCHFTRINYLAAFKRMTHLGLINPKLTLQVFSLVNHEAVVDDIKLVDEWSEATRQARAAAYISFTGFLQRRTQGVVRKAMPSKEGTNKTFFKVREKVKTESLSQSQTRRFLQALEIINKRDCLIAKLMLQGGKRKFEVLNLKVSQIDFPENRISFEQTKTRGIIKVTVVNYPEHVMTELKEYIGDRKEFVFVTRSGNRISPTQIDRNFAKAGIKADIPFKVTPHMLRVTLVTRLKELRVQDSDIMKITGHASPTQLSSYDKSDLADNASLYHNFI